MNHHSYTPNQERKIHAMMTSEMEVSIIAGCKIYTSNIKGKEWLYSDLEGLLVLILDHQNKTRYLIVYESFSFEKLFQYELYSNFSSYFLTIAPDFRCFEIEGGFIGLQFDLVKEVGEFEFMLKKLEGELLKCLFDSRPLLKSYEDIEEKMRRFSKVIKDSLSIETNYDENYAEDGIEINKARNFEMLNNISFNRDTKQFEIGEISEELRNVFREAGIRKKDLTNDLNFAFLMVKKIILGVSENQDLLNNEYLRKDYPQPENLPYMKNEEQKIARSNSNEIRKSRNNVNNNIIARTDNISSKIANANNAIDTNQKPKMATKPVLEQTNNDSLQGVENLQDNNIIIKQTNHIPDQEQKNKGIKKPNSIKPNINSKIAPPKNSTSKISTNEGNNSSSNSFLVKLKPINQNQSTTKPIEQTKPKEESKPIIQPPINKSTISQPPPITTTPKSVQVVKEKKLEPIQDVKEDEATKINLPVPPPNTFPKETSTKPPQIAPGSIPLPPPLLGPIFIPTVPTNNAESQQKSREEELNSIKLKKVSAEEAEPAQLSMYEQIQNIKLKAVQKDTAPPQKLMTKNEQNFLQNSLAMALQQRRKNILKHQEEDSESDEDW